MISPNDVLQPSPEPHFKTFQVFLIYLLSVKVPAPHKATLQMKLFSSLLRKFMSNLLMKAVFFLLNVALAEAILD